VALVRLTFFAAMYLASSVQLVVAQTNFTPLYDTPVYFAPAKKYFALIDVRYKGPLWYQAEQNAESRVFKGVHGRLAVVDSLEVHEFLLMTFHSEFESWIGLRYWCDRHKLEWSDGRFLEPGSFQAWDSAWMREGKTCSGAAMPNNPEQYMPVAYNPISKGPFRWIAKGWYKGYFSYFIEFPTGGP